MPELADRILTDDADGAAKAVSDLAADLIERLDRVVPLAVGGSAGAVRSYVTVWRELEARTLGALHSARPDLVIEAEDGTYLIVEVKRPARAVLDQWALHAPFSPWTKSFGCGLGVAVSFIAELREHLPEGRPLVPSPPAGRTGILEWEEHDLWRFFRLGLLELEEARPPLARVADLFDLSLTELGSLFGVSRQAASDWLERGVPPGRAPKANELARLADILERNLRPERIPGIVRQPAEAYDGRSMLEMIAADRHDELVRRVADAFDWAKAA